MNVRGCAGLEGDNEKGPGGGLLITILFLSLCIDKNI